MGITHTNIEDIKTKQLIWYSNEQRMSEERILKQILNQNPQGRRKRGRLRKSSQESMDGKIRARSQDGPTDRDWVSEDDVERYIPQKKIS